MLGPYKTDLFHIYNFKKHKMLFTSIIIVLIVHKLEWLTIWNLPPVIKSEYLIINDSCIVLWHNRLVYFVITECKFQQIFFFLSLKRDYCLRAWALPTRIEILSYPFMKFTKPTIKKLKLKQTLSRRIWQCADPLPCGAARRLEKKWDSKAISAIFFVKVEPVPFSE